MYKKTIITECIIGFVIGIIFMFITKNILTADEQSYILTVVLLWYLGLRINARFARGVKKILLYALKAIFFLLAFTGLRYSGDSDYVLPEHHIIITVVLIVFFLITLIATYWKYLQLYIRKQKTVVPSFNPRPRSTYQNEEPIYRRTSPEPNYTYHQEHDENDLYSLDPYEYENAVAEYFRDKGYFDVDTTPRSGDYGADVIAKSPNGKKICVQCKRYKEDNRVGVKAVQEIYSAKGYYNCEQAYIFTTSSYTPQAQEMADRLGVVLVVYRNVNP